MLECPSSTDVEEDPGHAISCTRLNLDLDLTLMLYHAEEAITNTCSNDFSQGSACAQ